MTTSTKPRSDAPELTVWGMPAMWGVPSASPFCIKLETWLRMAGIDYVTRAVDGPIRSSKGKVPYVVRADGEIMEDSGHIIERLTVERGVTLDAHLGPEQRAQALLVRRLVEDHLYFVLLWSRWSVDETWQAIRPDYFGSLPPVVRQLVPVIARRSVRGYLHGQGMGRHEPEEIWAAGEADLEALSVLLGDRAWFFDAPSTTDAIVYGFLSGVLACPVQDRLAAAIRARPNLVAHTDRVAATYWA